MKGCASMEGGDVIKILAVGVPNGKDPKAL